jgi:hypothetical protein
MLGNDGKQHIFESTLWERSCNMWDWFYTVSARCRGGIMPFLGMSCLLCTFSGIGDLFISRSAPIHSSCSGGSC